MAAASAAFMALRAGTMAKKAASMPFGPASLHLQPAALPQKGARMARRGARLRLSPATLPHGPATLTLFPSGVGEKSGVDAPRRCNAAPSTGNTGPSSGNAAPKRGNAAGLRGNEARSRGRRRRLTPRWSSRAAGEGPAWPCHRLVRPTSSSRRLSTAEWLVGPGPGFERCPGRPETSHAAATGSPPGPHPANGALFPLWNPHRRHPQHRHPGASRDPALNAPRPSGGFARLHDRPSNKALPARPPGIYSALDHSDALR